MSVRKLCKKSSFSVESLEHRELLDAAGFIQGIYHSSLGRDATAGEVAYWKGQMDQNGASSVVGNILSSDERHVKEIESAFQSYLKRSSGQGDRSYWVGQFHNGLTSEELEKQVILSNEYGGGKSDDTFIGNVYKDKLGRTAGQDEVNYWKSQSAGDRSNVVKGIGNSGERIDRVLRDQFKDAFGDTTSQRGDFEKFFADLKNGRDRNEVFKDIINSTRFGNDHDFHGTHPWINQMYMRILGRAPTKDELTYWDSQQATADSNSQIVTALVQSNEARARAYLGEFTTLMKRPPTKDEMTSYLTRRSNSETEYAVVKDLVLGTEYQTAHADNAEFVKSLFNGLYHTKVMDQEVATWVQQLSSGTTRGQLYDNILSSDTAAYAVTYDMFKQALNRPPSPSELTYFGNMFKQNHDKEQLAIALFSSHEFGQPFGFNDGHDDKGPPPGAPGSGTPGSGTPGGGTPGNGTPGSGTPGSGDPGKGNPPPGSPPPPNNGGQNNPPPPPPGGTTPPGGQK